ncbi:hypothetical protein SSX86_032262 [Deinandra increscens subsp. villosa]|uniref:Dof zinc finger protein n=1 Tax=Deinandra increscens subsp. villosa TaxID=3103831 RepID=A0AAP0C4G3_9ASTR
MSDLDGSESKKRRCLRTQPQTDPLTCPRCESTNTKFCYYNNYNKTQPRYFCKACKRHWTSGGVLRNVPVGGQRKNKRPRPSVMTAANSSATNHESKSSFFRPVSGEKDDEESYTDIEELKGLVSWDFIKMIEDGEDSTSATSMIMASSQQTSNMNWNDLDIMIDLEDLNKPWEDPTFKT